MRTDHVSAHQIDQHLVAINSAPADTIYRGRINAHRYAQANHCSMMRCR